MCSIIQINGKEYQNIGELVKLTNSLEIPINNYYKAVAENILSEEPSCEERACLCTLDIEAFCKKFGYTNLGRDETYTYDAVLVPITLT